MTRAITKTTANRTSDLVRSKPRGGLLILPRKKGHGAAPASAVPKSVVQLLTMMGAVHPPAGWPASAGLLDATMVIRARKTAVSRISFFIVSLLSGGNSDIVHLSVTVEVCAKLYHNKCEAENK